MPSSKRYSQLKSRIGELRNHFLPPKFDPTGTYTKRQIDRTRAFRLLAHAEIEWYLEEIVVDTANKAFQSWQQRGLVTKPLISMVAYFDGKLGRVPKNLSGSSELSLEDRIATSRNQFNTYAKSRNHGIKEKNILKLLLPIGISETEIDQTWLSTTHSFGRSRGEAAHFSNQVYNPPDPQNELNIVNQVITGLLQIDSKLAKF